MRSSGHILVVDDSRSMQIKMTAATKALGHTAVAVGGGAAALAHMRDNAVDAVLLDIMMPEMDGFEVLQAMKAEARLRDIPVIVISGLEDTESAVRAIELGAEDFLPKNFDPVIFRARVNTLLQKKFVRDAEIDYLRQVDKLAQAARILQAGNYNPSKLGLDDISRRDDPLGDLARVFSDAVQKVYERERLLRHSLKTLRGAIGLVILGLVWGLAVPLAKIADQFGAPPIGMAFWVSLISAVTCLSISAAKGWLPPWRSIPPGYFALYALLGAVLSQSLLYLVAGHVEASLVAIIVVFESFLVFAITAVMGIEKPSLTRFAGLAMGLCGVLIIILSKFHGAALSDTLWTIAALSVPLCYALEGVLVAERRPLNIRAVPMVGIMQAFAAVMLLGLAWASGQLFMLNPVPGKLDLSILALAATSVFANCLFFYLIQQLGSVFASQNAYFVTAAGIGWSMLLLNEFLTGWVWVALALMGSGLALVGAKREAEQEPPPVAAAPLRAEPARSGG